MTDSSNATRAVCKQIQGMFEEWGKFGELPDEEKDEQKAISMLEKAIGRLRVLPHYQVDPRILDWADRFRSVTQEMVALELKRIPIWADLDEDGKTVLLRKLGGIGMAYFRGGIGNAAFEARDQFSESNNPQNIVEEILKEQAILSASQEALMEEWGQLIENFVSEFGWKEAESVSE